MDLTAICGLLAAVTGLAGLLFAIFQIRLFNRRVSKFEGLADSALSFLRYETSENGEPLLDARLVKILQTVGASLAQSVKMSVLGALSGPARLEKGLKGAMANDIVENNIPMLNLIGDFLGFNTKKYIAKHPEAMLQLVNQLGPMFLKNQGFGFLNSNPIKSGGELGKIG